MLLNYETASERERGLDTRFRGYDGGLCVSNGLIDSEQLRVRFFADALV